MDDNEHENERKHEALLRLVAAWDRLPGGTTYEAQKNVASWVRNYLKPVAEMSRKLLEREPDTRTSVIMSIASELEAEGKYLSAESLRALALERDEMRNAFSGDADDK